MAFFIAAAALALLAGAALLARWALERLVERRIAEYQSDLLKKQMDEVENMYRQMRGWRHDFHNHIQTMKAFTQLGRLEELSGYLDQLDADLVRVDQLVKSGNIMADAILNSKLSLAKERGIAINVKAVVPKELKVSEVDLCVILGNLLDNATEACLRIPEPEKRFLRLYVGTFKEQLYISVANSAGEGLRREGRSYRSEKAGSHGFGLLRLDRIAERCGGLVNRQSEEGVFATEVLLPL